MHTQTAALLKAYNYVNKFWERIWCQIILQKKLFAAFCSWSCIIYHLFQVVRGPVYESIVEWKHPQRKTSWLSHLRKPEIRNNMQSQRFAEGFARACSNTLPEHLVVVPCLENGVHYRFRVAQRLHVCHPLCTDAWWPLAHAFYNTRAARAHAIPQAACYMRMRVNITELWTYTTHVYTPI